MLSRIQSPADVRALSIHETKKLAAEIRQALIDAVAMSGGHLASNLGAVELTLALHRAFHMPDDKIVFDVGHQSYTHKLITGRQQLLTTLRQEGGISGFPKREESPEYDCFDTGHASTAISAALGFARARDALHQHHAGAALVGDGALTGGLCYEALNDAGSRPTQLVVLLNDNEMSIAKNVGALARYLTNLRGSRRWIGTKQAVKKGLVRVPLVGPPLTSAFEKIKRTVKLMLVPGEFFEALGFQYLGPIDGHDIELLEKTLKDARRMGVPVVVHAVTHKGKGYALAERQPEQFHGVAPFFAENGKQRGSGEMGQVSVARVVGDTLAALGKEDLRVCAITAAMPQGTGLSAFAFAYPERCFDVGIAEEHAVTLAAGMAAGGMRPVFAVYASFLQRATDELLHDVCLQNLPVTLLVDHAGFVPGDGATHQGVYDVAMLRAMPNLTVWAPADAGELSRMIRAAVDMPGPVAIRYPKQLPQTLADEAPVGTWRQIAPGERVAIVGYGASVQMALEARALLLAQGVQAEVVSASSLSPLDDAMLRRLSAYPLIAVVEEAQVRGGLGEAVVHHFHENKTPARVLTLGIRGIIPAAHSMEGLRRECGLDAATLAARILEGISDGISLQHNVSEFTPPKEAPHGK